MQKVGLVEKAKVGETGGTSVKASFGTVERAKAEGKIFSTRESVHIRNLS